MDRAVQYPTLGLIFFRNNAGHESATLTAKIKFGKLPSSAITCNLAIASVLPTTSLISCGLYFSSCGAKTAKSLRSKPGKTACKQALHPTLRGQHQTTTYPWKLKSTCFRLWSSLSSPWCCIYVHCGHFFKNYLTVVFGCL